MDTMQDANSHAIDVLLQHHLQRLAALEEAEETEKAPVGLGGTTVASSVIYTLAPSAPWGAGTATSLGDYLVYSGSGSSTGTLVVGSEWGAYTDASSTLSTSQLEKLSKMAETEYFKKKVDTPQARLERKLRQIEGKH